MGLHPTFTGQTDPVGESVAGPIHHTIQLYDSEYSLNSWNWPYWLASTSPEELVLCV